MLRNEADTAVLDGADRGRVFDNLTPPITVGREEGNTIQLNDERISRYHVKIQEDHNRLVITDLESTNGTKVNNEDVQLRILRFGDMIQLGRSVLLFAEETGAMLPALFVGAAIAGLIQVGVSRDVLTTLGGDPLWSVLALMVLAFVISICLNVDAFFVLSFGSTFLPGGIIAFLVFGPMIDIKMLALLRTTFSARTLVRITALIGLCAAVLGLAVNHAL